MQEKQVERSIQFFRLQGWCWGRNKAWEEVDLGPVFERINKMGYSLEGRYLKRSNGDELVMIDVDIGENRLRGKFGVRRLTNLPYEEIGGTEIPLSLEEDACLFEPSHFVVFEGDILGMEFNFYGPRASALKAYLGEKGEGHVNIVDVVPLLRHDITELLKKVGEVSLFHVAVHRDGIDQVRELDEKLGTALKAAAEASVNAEQIEITLRPLPHARKSIDLPFIGKIGSWLKKSESYEAVEKIEIRGKSRSTGRTEWFDILSDKLVSKKTVLKEDVEYRHINSASMYKAIEEAYKEMKEEIRAIIGK